MLTVMGRCDLGNKTGSDSAVYRTTVLCATAGGGAGGERKNARESSELREESRRAGGGEREERGASQMIMMASKDHEHSIVWLEDALTLVLVLRDADSLMRGRTQTRLL